MYEQINEMGIVNLCSPITFLFLLVLSRIPVPFSFSLALIGGVNLICPLILSLRLFILPPSLPPILRSVIYFPFQQWKWQHPSCTFRKFNHRQARNKKKKWSLSWNACGAWRICNPFVKCMSFYVGVKFASVKCNKLFVAKGVSGKNIKKWALANFRKRE